MHNSTVNCICLSSDNKYIISGSEDQTISIIDLQIVQKIQTLKGHDNMVYSVFFTPNEEILSGSSDGTIRMWKNLL